MKRIFTFAFFFLAWIAIAGEAPRSAAAQAIVAVIDAQSVAWNRGDIDAFMQGYAQTDDLRFASGANVTYGWRATLEGYKKHYPDRTAMGTLTFSEVVVTELAPDAAIVFGRWKLTRDSDTPNGLFTLTFKRTPAGWRIIQDHTSSASK
jgi:ketosteroid isomerase-like protein